MHHSSVQSQLASRVALKLIASALMYNLVPKFFGAHTRSVTSRIHVQSDLNSDQAMLQDGGQAPVKAVEHKLSKESHGQVNLYSPN